MKKILVAAALVAASIAPAFAQSGLISGLAGRLAVNVASQSATLLSPTMALNTAYNGSTTPFNGLLFAPLNAISYCPTLSCVTSPSTDHQRASALISSITQDDSHSEEQTLGVETTIQTGYAPNWTASHAYTLGQNAINGAYVYRVTTAGTSASSGGPTGTGSAITDGGVTWAWINNAAIASKVGVYNETVVLPGAGHAWSQANNFQMQSGVIPTFDVNTELDFTNNAANCNVGSANCLGLYLTAQGAYESTALETLATINTGPTYGAHFGIRLAGTYLDGDQDISDDASGAYGIGFGVVTASSHSGATIYDNSTSPNSLQINGTHSSSAISVNATTPAALAVGGAPGTAALWDLSSAPTSVRIAGSHTNGVYVGDGSSTTAMYVGLSAASGNSLSSSPINMAWTNSSGTENTSFIKMTPTGLDTSAAAIYPNTANTTTLGTSANYFQQTYTEIVNLVPYTVATLPTCNAGMASALASVTDAASPAWNATLTGGGSTRVMAFCNGSNWTAH